MNPQTEPLNPQTVFNRAQLCKRRNISDKTLTKFIDKGVITPMKGTTSYFSLAAIEAAEKYGIPEEETLPIDLKRKIRELEKANAKKDEKIASLTNRIMSLAAEATAGMI